MHRISFSLLTLCRHYFFFSLSLSSSTRTYENSRSLSHIYLSFVFFGFSFPNFLCCPSLFVTLLSRTFFSSLPFLFSVITFNLWEGWKYRISWMVEAGFVRSRYFSWLPVCVLTYWNWQFPCSVPFFSFLFYCTSFFGECLLQILRHSQNLWFSVIVYFDLQ